jgi:hypothetical protein
LLDLEDQQLEYVSGSEEREKGQIFVMEVVELFYFGGQ